MIEKIKVILDKYSFDDADTFGDTISMLVNKGVPNGCYQDYAMLADLMDLLSQCEIYIRSKELSK